MRLAAAIMLIVNGALASAICGTLTGLICCNTVGLSLSILSIIFLSMADVREEFQAAEGSSL